MDYRIGNRKIIEHDNFDSFDIKCFKYQKDINILQLKRELKNKFLLSALVLLLTKNNS